jgi:hypothetical protein
MVSAKPGPAYPFYKEVERVTDRLGMSMRELDDRSGVAATTINGLKTASPKGRARRRSIILSLAGALNTATKELHPDWPLPFPDEEETLRLAGLIEPEPDPVDLRERIKQSKYGPEGQQALLSLVDFLDSQMEQQGRDQRTA